MIELFKIPYWIPAYDLPLNSLIEIVVKLIGNKAIKSLSYDTNNVEVWVEFIRIEVMLDFGFLIGHGTWIRNRE